MIAALALVQATPPEGETQSTVLGTLLESIQDGGWMMVPIGLCSVVALGFFLERWLALGAGRLLPRRFVGELGSTLGKGADDALKLCSETQAPVARILGAGLQRWHEPRPQIEKAIEDAGAREVSRLTGNLRPLVVVASIAPLLGLLGTVIGMIKAFSVIATEKGIGKPEMLADGISQALITTAAGLIVAIPAQVAYFYLKAKIDRFTRGVENLFLDVIGPHLDERTRSAA